MSKYILSLMIIFSAVYGKADSVLDQFVDGISTVATIGTYATLVENQKALIQAEFRKREAEIRLKYAVASKEYRKANEQAIIENYQSELNGYTFLKKNLDESYQFYLDLAKSANELLTKNNVTKTNFESLESLAQANSQVTEIEINATLPKEAKASELESLCNDGNELACISSELIKADGQTQAAKDKILQLNSDKNLQKIYEVSLFQMQTFTHLQAMYSSRIQTLTIELNVHKTILESLK